MSKKVDTWMPLLVDKYLGDTQHLNTEQHGAYLLLLMSMWKRGGTLPDDDQQLAQIAKMTPARWRANRPVLVEFFGRDGGALVQKRLGAELRRAEAHAEAKAEAGRKGASKRWQTDGTAIGKPDGTAMADACDSQWQTGTPIPTPIPMHPSDAPVSIAEAVASAVDETPSAPDRPALTLVPPADRQSLPDCPHQELIALYRKHLPHLRQPAKWDGQRADEMRTRWRECAAPSSFGDGYATKAEGLEFWSRFFAFVATCPKLRDGITTRERGGEVRVWRPSLDWLVHKSNFLKVIEGAYAP